MEEKRYQKRRNYARLVDEDKGNQIDDDGGKETICRKTKGKAIAPKWPSFARLESNTVPPILRVHVLPTRAVENKIADFTKRNRDVVTSAVSYSVYGGENVGRVSQFERRYQHVA